MNRSLYEIDLSLANLLIELERLQACELEFGADREKLIQSCLNDIDELAIAKDDKLQALWYYDHEDLAEIEALASHERYYRDRKWAKQAARESRHRYISSSIQQGKWKYGIAEFSHRKSEAVECLPEELEKTPEAYRRTKWEPDKTTIKNDIKSGANIPGWKLVERKHLQVK